MTDLWLPPGALAFDEDIERVIAESDDPAFADRNGLDASELQVEFPSLQQELFT